MCGVVIAPHVIFTVGLPGTEEKAADMRVVFKKEEMQKREGLRVPGTDGHVDRRNSPVFSWSL